MKSRHAMLPPRGPDRSAPRAPVHRIPVPADHVDCPHQTVLAMFCTAEMALFSSGLKGGPVSKAQRRTSTYPAVVQAAKSDYELLGLGYRLLSRRYGIPRTTIAFHAIKEKWVKPGLLPSGASEGCA